MRIGIDACCWSNRRGFGRFTRELVTPMVQEFPGHEFFLVTDHWTAEHADFPAGARIDVVRTQQQPTQAASADGSRSLVDLWRMSRAAARRRLDAFFFPAVYSYFPLTRRVPTAVTFHDAIAEQHPGLIFSGFKSRLLWNVKTWLARRQADRLVTVSESAREQVASAFRIPASRIHVISEGPGAIFRPIDDPVAITEIRRRYGLPAGLPMVLYVGGISPHKNLQGLLHALSKVAQTPDLPWHLTLVGDFANDSFHSCYAEIRDLARNLAIGDRVTFTGYVPNEDLVTLYNAATLLVLPSFSEGFGLPVVEAMACGLPVAVSRTGSLPEVVGPAGLLFDPRDPADIAGALQRLLGDTPLRAQLRAEGLRRAASFSWKAAAHKLVRLLEEMAHASATA